MHKGINKKGSKNEEGINLHVKPGNVAEHLHSNLESESGPSNTEETCNLSKSHNFDDDMAFFDKTTIQFLQHLHFYTRVFKLVFGCIKSFDVQIDAMKNNVDGIPSNPRWYF